MKDPIEQLALSRTFVWNNGSLTEQPQAAANSAAAEMLRPGALIDGKYQVIGLIASGGIGAVYKVHHSLLQKDMALKTFLSHEFSPDAWLRFQREAQAIARLHHKNIVDVFDFGIAEGRLPYYTMELLQGKSLADEIDESGPMQSSESIKLFVQIADALSHAHRQQIIHRDIKPANIIVLDQSTTKTPGITAKVVDFGVAKLAENKTSPVNQSHTQLGTIFGSPLYMSPEQSLGLPTDQTTDIYSFGCALYETLTGKPPFLGNTAHITMLFHQRQDAPTLAASGADNVFSPKLESTLAKLMAKNPRDRFQSFNEVKNELELCLKTLPSRSTAAQDKNWSMKKKAVVAGSTDKATVPMSLLRRILLVTVIILAFYLCLGTLFAVTSVLPRQRGMTPAITHTVKVDTDTVVNSALIKSETPKTASQSKFYLVEEIKDPAGDKKVFEFPPEEMVGGFSLEGEHNSIVCSGKVVVSKKSKIVFNAGEGPFTKPALFGKFHPDDLYGIVLAPQPNSNSDGDWSDEHLLEISKLSGLRSLNFSRAHDLTAIGAESLNKLKILIRLNISYAGLKNDGLAKLTILSQIKTLDISGTVNPTEALTKMVKNNCQTENLVANYCDLTAEDLSLIGKFKNLKVLSLTGNNINNKTLLSLSPASRLESLCLSENPINDDSISALARYRSLKDLSLTNKFFTMAGRDRLSKLLPKNCILDDLEDVR